jgi:hypothetical protein
MRTLAFMLAAFLLSASDARAVDARQQAPKPMPQRNAIYTLPVAATTLVGDTAAIRPDHVDDCARLAVLRAFASGLDGAYRSRLAELTFEACLADVRAGS